jgi:hypothetical protein
MKIAIIGCGWVGCHLAYKLKNNHNISLFDSSGIFNKTSYRNQNRLHMGFHYPRSFKTRKLCLETFDRFINDYRDLVLDVPMNIYGVPENKSVIDFDTYKNILTFEDIPYNNIEIKSIKNIEGFLLCNEKQINHIAAKKKFENQFNDYLTIHKFDNSDIVELSKEYDLVINATNNQLKNHNDKSYYELSLIMVYEKVIDTEFEAITLMDGPFISIYPYENNKYTISDVEFTPLIKSESLTDIRNFNKDPLKNKSKIEEKIAYFFPDFYNSYKYVEYYTAVKIKNFNQNANRYPNISIENNIINCYTGKIQGIYQIEEQVKNIINENINR